VYEFGCTNEDDELSEVDCCVVPLFDAAPTPLPLGEALGDVLGASTGGNSIQMGGFGSLLEVVVPDPPRIVRRARIERR